MAFASYSKMDDAAQLHGQPEINKMSQVEANDYDSLQDRKTSEDANAFVKGNNRGANSAEGKEDGTQKGNIPYWIYEHPRRIIALVVVGVLLFTALSCVITGAIVHRMILTNLDTRLVATDRKFNSEHIKGTDSISYSHSDTVGQLNMNRRLENIETSLLNLQENHTSHIITDMNGRLEEIQERQNKTIEGLHKLQEDNYFAINMNRQLNTKMVNGFLIMQQNHSDAIVHLLLMNSRWNKSINGLNMTQENLSDAIDRFIEVNRELNKTMDDLHKIQEHHSDKIDHLADVTRQVNKSMDGFHIIQENQTDAIDHLTDANRQLNNAMDGIHKMQTNHSGAINHLTEVSRQLVATMDGLHKMQENQSDANDHLTEVTCQLNNTMVELHKVQENRSDAIIDHLTDVNRQLNKTMDDFHKMQENQSDAIDHLSDLNGRLDKMVQHLYKMLGNRSDSETLDQITDINRRLVKTAEAVYRVLEQVKAAVPVPGGCMECPDGWTQFGDTCYKLSDGNIDFTIMALRVCPDGWTSCKGSCYKKGSSSVTFNGGVEYCKRYNASLVEINTSAENEFIKGFLRTSDICWIGLTDLESEGVWKWHGSGEITQFTYWNSGEPNNAGGEDCTTVVGVRRFKWNDLPCNKRAIPLCESWSTS